MCVCGLIAESGLPVRSRSSAAALRLQGRAAARCVPRRRTLCWQAKLSHCLPVGSLSRRLPRRASRGHGVPSGAGGPFPRKDRQPKAPFPPAWPWEPVGTQPPEGSSRGRGHMGRSLQTPECRLLCLRVTPALRDPGLLHPYSYTLASRRRGGNAKGPGLPCPSRVSAPAPDPPESETPSPNSPK